MKIALAIYTFIVLASGSINDSWQAQAGETTPEEVQKASRQATLELEKK